MGESEFLKWQDKNGDGLNDACDDLIEVAEAVNCPDCVKNPSALVPDWTSRTKEDPFLNEKLCLYQITVVTEHTTTISEILLEKYATSGLSTEEQEGATKERFDSYRDEAIEALLNYYDKDESEESKQAIRDVIEYTEYDLNPRAKSRLKLLYSVPFADLGALADAEEESDDDEETETGDVEVTYEAGELLNKLIRIRKGLNLYARHKKVYVALEGGNIFFQDSDQTEYSMGFGVATSTAKVPTIFDLDLYGDIGAFNGSIMAKVLTQLDEFLNNKGYNLPGTGKLFGSIGRDQVNKVTFKFNEKFELKKMTIFTQTCGEKPIIFMKKLSSLKKKSAWKDPTAMAYLARLNAMETDLTARTPKPWLEFIEEHTYPPVYSSINAAYANTDPVNSVGSCVATALAEEGKQLGQDILDDVFGLGDAIASAFHKNLCQYSLGEETDLMKEQGFYRAPGFTDLKSLKGAALEQAFKDIDPDDQVFVYLCAAILGSGSKNPELASSLDDIWELGLDPIKECGLFDLVINAVECLMGGLTLEEALASMVKSALRAMSIENFGDLFIGLPPDKQTELDALVKKKLESGDIFEASDQGGAAGSGQELSDILAGVKKGVKALNPTNLHLWKKKEVVEEDNSKKKEGPLEGMSSTDRSEPTMPENRTLAQQFDVKTQAEETLSPNIVMEAYVLALIEVYADDLLGLVDLLNKFPGAQIISKVIAMFDCPRPPLFNPSVLDFVKDIELPFCRSMNDITLPRLVNPFGWLPSWMDIWAIIYLVAWIQINKLIVSIMMKLLIKLCELIGNAICKALETVGDLAAALPSMVTGRNTFSDVVRESICGEDADQEQIDNTIIDMVSSMGAGGAALADREQTLQFAEDISSASTTREITDAFLGEPSDEFLDIVESIIEYEYPEFQDALRNKETIGSMFKNMGNLLPVDAKDQMRQSVDASPFGGIIPANPTLCATPEQLEQFQDLRCELLDGRATKEECKQMFDNVQAKMLDDLDDLGDILQKGIPSYLDDNMPSLVSDPGCDNGLLPFEDEDEVNATASDLSDDLEQLKIDFSYDMLGNGPGMANWGFINMVMSDTMGNPFTTHQRKSFFRSRKYVDFYVDEEDSDGTDDQNYAAIKKQRGAYPHKIAGWLEEYLQDTFSATFNSNNEYEEDVNTYVGFDDLGISNFRGSPQHLLMLPDMGYNIERSVNISSEAVKFTEKARKKTPDMTLEFYDNASGLEKYEDTYGYGFSIDMFLSDLYEDSAGAYINRADDNARIKITQKVNLSVTEDPNTDYKTDDQLQEESSADDPTIVEEPIFEFIGVDNTLNEIDTSDYTEFLSTFTSKQDYLPQVVLMKEILNSNGGSFNNETIKSLHDDVMTTITETFASEIGENEPAFLYGAVFDDLTTSDVDYLTEDGEDYFEAEIEDENASYRKIRNSDMVLGISRDQYENGDDARVIYLDPAQYGGSYTNPPLYVKPLKNEGWLGFIDVVFPDISPCKPYRTDLVDFADIDQQIGNAYPTIPEDERLKSDPDCIVELPYNRILERPSAAGIQGLISAAIRIYVSTYFIKSMATFTKFYPKFPETFSAIYASYIVERMEESFKSAQKALWEFFNPFKDQEFWYAFLEQSVQMYGRRVDSGEIQEPPSSVLSALQELNDSQENYEYADKEGLKEEKEDGSVSRFKTLKNYRSEKNLEAVQETEDLAKIVLTELVTEQLTYMGEKFIVNLKILEMVPDIYDLDYYLLTNLTQGGIDLDLDKEIQEEPVDLPTEGEEHYTGGGELYVFEKNDTTSEFEEGEEYVGYYHVSEDEEGNNIYMAGEFHSEGAHDTLAPFAGGLTVPIGDIEEYEYSPETDASRPFVIEKYIAINGTRYAPSEAQDIILANDNALNISDVYPGTLSKVTDHQGKVVGLEGELGVRYGIQFSIIVDGTKTEITSVEMDVLDLSIGQFAPFQGDSKLLLCMINLLKGDNKFKLVSHYIFPLNKVTSLMAIYNDFAFLPSIGQVTVEKGDLKDEIGTKPGMAVEFDDEGNASSVVSEEGWANKDDRRRANIIKTWDDWDQILLRNSKSRIKKLFKDYYNSRDFTPGEDDEEDKVARVFINSLRESFKPAAGQRLLPWWKKRSLRTNPFNANDELCENND